MMIRYWLRFRHVGIAVQLSQRESIVSKESPSQLWESHSTAICKDTVSPKKIVVVPNKETMIYEIKFEQNTSTNICV